MMSRGFLLGVVPSLLLYLPGCGAGLGPEAPDPVPPETTSDGRWVRIDSIAPAAAPYLFPTRITVHGAGFDGIRSVGVAFRDHTLFVEPGGGRTSTRLTFRTPQPLPRWSTAGVIVSETPVVQLYRKSVEPWQQSDTLGQALTFQGPVPGDTVVYEFRRASFDGGAVVRWRRSDFPLGVWFDPVIPARLHEPIWTGITAWSHRVAPRVPNFVRTDSFEEADIRWTTTRTGCGTIWGEGQGRPKVAVLCPPENYARMPPGIATDFAAHETGHALGIHNHSHRDTDVMGTADFGKTGLSEADVRSLRALYNLPVSDPLFP